MLDAYQRCNRVRALFALGLVLLMPCGAARAAGPVAISACGMISAPGNYVVTKNLTASGDCLTLTVSNVAIDLQGHQLKGNGTGAGITDGGHGIAFIIVANGKITNFSTGIDLPTLPSQSDQTADLVLNMNVSGNAADGINIGGRDNNLANLTASNNGGNGIVQGDCCDSLFDLTTNGNGADGVHFNTEDSLLKVTSNGNAGKGVSGASDCFVVNSVANRNGGAGVELMEGHCLVVSSAANHNKGDGFLLVNNQDQVTNSRAGNNQSDGIDFQGTLGLVTSVVTNHNTNAGVFLTCPGNAVRVSAQGNAANLDENSAGGTCTNARNHAP